jgi:nitronate monooxygenase
MGYKQHWFEKLLSNNQRTRKYFKMLVQIRGMKKLEQAVKPNNYLQLWTAGQSVEMVHEVSSIKDIVADITTDLKGTLEKDYL